MATDGYWNGAGGQKVRRQRDGQPGQRELGLIVPGFRLVRRRHAGGHEHARGRRDVLLQERPAHERALRHQQRPDHDQGQGELPAHGHLYDRAGTRRPAQLPARLRGRHQRRLLRHQAGHQEMAGAGGRFAFRARRPVARGRERARRVLQRQEPRRAFPGPDRYPEPASRAQRLGRRRGDLEPAAGLGRPVRVPRELPDPDLERRAGGEDDRRLDAGPLQRRPVVGREPARQ